MTDGKYGAPKAWITAMKEQFLAGKICELCGQQHVPQVLELRVFTHIGAPQLRWGRSGPSHTQYRIVCGDPTACLRWRGPKAPRMPQSKPSKVEPAPVEKATISGLTPWGPPKPVGPTKIEKDLTKPDERPVCPAHGPKNLLQLNGEMRFVCCGRIHEVIVSKRAFGF